MRRLDPLAIFAGIAILFVALVGAVIYKDLRALPSPPPPAGPEKRILNASFDWVHVLDTTGKRRTFGLVAVQAEDGTTCVFEDDRPREVVIGELLSCAWGPAPYEPRWN